MESASDATDTKFAPKNPYHNIFRRIMVPIPLLFWGMGNRLKNILMRQYAILLELNFWNRWVLYKSPVYSMGQRGHSQAAFLTNRQYALNSLTARKTILFELSIRVSYNFRKVVDIKGDHLIE